MTNPTATSDVLVRIREPIDEAGQSRVADAVASLDGVRGVRNSIRLRNLLVVYFDPSTASSREVLRAVQSQGFTASLVGL
jgi:hypothetical protein